MAAKLTKYTKVNDEKIRLSKLTNQHDAHFKLIFSHQTERLFNFSSLYSRQDISSSERQVILRNFGTFIDDSVHLTITEVERKYKRNTDRSDGTYDPEQGTGVQIEHFALFSDDAKPNRASDKVRLHGYYRNNGYFVLTKLDWFHLKH